MIVVDDGGSAALRVRDDIAVRLIRKCNGGPASARNAGASEAAGRFLAFTDDDCEPGQDWLSALARRLAERPDALVGGIVLNGLTANPYAEASQAIVDFSLGQLNAEEDDSQFFPSNNFAVSADHYRSVGGFDPLFRKVPLRIATSATGGAAKG